MRYSGDYDLYSREEIEALIRHAASEQDAAVYATAAMTGLRRGELVGLRWRDVDFAGQAIRVRGNYSHGEVVTPKSGKVRVVPMVPEVAQHLARLGQRERFARDDDPVFVSDVGATSTPRHSDGATRPPASGLSCAYCRSIRCAIILGRSPSTGLRSSKSRRGSGTGISRRRPGTSTIVLRPRTRRCWPRPSRFPARPVPR